MYANERGNSGKTYACAMVEHNTDNHETAFTVSIDHKNTTTGISAEERGFTARMCVDENAEPLDFRRPGHMFPLIAKAGGVLELKRTYRGNSGLMKLAGLKECGLCCEIMSDDGKMMRTDELISFAEKYNIPYITVKICRSTERYLTILYNAYQ